MTETPLISTITTGSGQKDNRSTIRKVLAVIIALLFIGVGIGGWYFYNNLQPALVVGDIKITKKQYADLINQASKDKLSKKDATDKLVEIEKSIYTAKSLNIKVSADSINEAGANIAGVYDPHNLNDWQRLNGEATAINNALLFSVNGGYDAAIYTFPFSRNFIQTLPNAPITDANFGNRTTIKADQDYASAQAKDVHDKLTKKTITSSAAVTQLRKDTRLDYGGASNDSDEFFVNLRGEINKQGETVIELLDPTYFSLLKTLKPGDISDIKTQKIFVNFSPLPDYKNKSVDADYFFVELKNKYDPNPDLQKQYDTHIKDVKVKRNV